MAEANKPKSDIIVLKEYFGYNGGTLSTFSAELKKLSTVEKNMLAEGIRNGSFTY